MTSSVVPEVSTLRTAVQKEYTEVAVHPEGEFHFVNGRPMAERLGYPMELVDAMPASAVESFAGVGNPFSAGTLAPGEQVGATGRVIGVDMTDAMLEKARASATAMGLSNVEFRHGFAEELPVEDRSMDVVISNGVINLCPDKYVAFREAFRVLKPGGRLQLADIVVHKDLPDDARAQVDLWTA